MSTKLTSFYSKYKINNKKHKKKNIILSVLIVAVSLAIILICTFGSFKREIWNEECEMYFVLADANLSNMNAESLKNKVEQAGGAGVVSDIDEYKNCVIILSYLTENDANKIKENCISVFPNTQVLCIKAPKINKNSQINNNITVQEILNFIISNKYESLENLLEFERGNLNFSKLYEYVYKLKGKVEGYYSMLGDGEDEEKFKIVLSKLQILLNSFLEDNLKSEFSALEFKKYIVTLMLEEISLRNEFL